MNKSLIRTSLNVISAFIALQFICLPAAAQVSQEVLDSNSNAESRMAARVRSDLITLDKGCGLTRGGEDSFVKYDTASYYNDIVSLSHLVLYWIRLGLQTQGYKPGYGNV